MQTQTTSKGFTLIELIVVIVILGILAAVAAPKFMDLQRDARIAKLEGIVGGIKSANELLHAFSVIHGLDGISLEAGVNYREVAVQYKGGSIERVPASKAEEEATIFLNYGYIAPTNSIKRNSGLLQVIDKNSVGDNRTVQNINTGSGDLGTYLCNPTEADIDLCYLASASPAARWTKAFVALKGFTGNECGFEYTAASKGTDNQIKPPKIVLHTTGC